MSDSNSEDEGSNPSGLVMKLDEKIKAVSLRKCGQSIKKIANDLRISTSTVSLWVRNVPCDSSALAVNTHQRIKERGAKWKQFNLLRRLNSQQIGRNEALQGNSQHLAGCMLYWAEGSKGRNSVEFTNSDIGMLQLFIKFLADFFGVNKQDLSVKITCYLNSGLSLKEIENYWITGLDLERSCLCKSTIKIQRKQKQKRSVYGVCSIRLGNTDILQRIYGSIQQYSGQDRPEWVE